MRKVDERSDPILQAIMAVRQRAASKFTPEFSGQRGEDYDRAVLDCYEAVSRVLTGAHP